MMDKAKESSKVKKAREKLKKKLALESEQINEKALNEMKKAIHHWLDRHSTERVPIKAKSFEFFDEKKHPARTKSKYVNRLLHKLEKEVKEEGEALDSLKGRITKKHG